MSAGEEARLTRRAVLKGALVAQAAVWTIPAVVVLTPDPALAGSSPPTTAIEPSVASRGGRLAHPAAPGDPSAPADPTASLSTAGGGEQTGVLASTGGPVGLLAGLGAGAVTAGAAAVTRVRRQRTSAPESGAEAG